MASAAVRLNAFFNECDSFREALKEFDKSMEEQNSLYVKDHLVRSWLTDAVMALPKKQRQEFLEKIQRETKRRIVQ